MSRKFIALSLAIGFYNVIRGMDLTPQQIRTFEQLLVCRCILASPNYSEEQKKQQRLDKLTYKKEKRKKTFKESNKIKQNLPTKFCKGTH